MKNIIINLNMIHKMNTNHNFFKIKLGLYHEHNISNIILKQNAQISLIIQYMMCVTEVTHILKYICLYQWTYNIINTL